MATRLILAMHASEGLRGSLLSLTDISPASLLLRDRALRRAVEADLKRFLERAIAIVTRRSDDVRALADALLARRMLTRMEIEDLLADPDRHRDRVPTNETPAPRAPEQHTVPVPPVEVETPRETAASTADDEGGESDADAPAAQGAGRLGNGDRR